jgi:hypothetical protein
MRDLFRDVRYAMRVLRRARGLSLATVVILAIGIGASTTIFSAMNGVLLRRLPYRRPTGWSWRGNPIGRSPRAATASPP